LSVEQFGAGAPLVLIHGLATNRHIWDQVIPALSERWRVVTLDVPGFGESEPAGPGFDLDAVGDRIARGLHARRVPRPVDLIGHSLGAGIAVTMAAARPRDVRRLVLVAPAGMSALPGPVSRLLTPGVDTMLAARRRLAPLTDFAWGRRWLLAFAAADGATVAPTQARLMLEASAGARRSSAAFAAIARADLLPLLQRIDLPLGLIWGTQDRTVPARIAAVVRERRPDAEIVMLDRAGHVPMIERPGEFVDALEGLLSRLPKDATSASAAAARLR
jgi:pimeloyl-[acyl-carrier protein] methyl ester esterase